MADCVCALDVYNNINFHVFASHTLYGVSMGINMHCHVQLWHARRARGHTVALARWGRAGGSGGVPDVAPTRRADHHAGAGEGRGQLSVSRRLQDDADAQQQRQPGGRRYVILVLANIISVGRIRCEICVACKSAKRCNVFSCPIKVRQFMHWIV